MISGSMFDDSLNNFIKKDIDGLSKKKKESRQKENKDKNEPQVKHKLNIDMFEKNIKKNKIQPPNPKVETNNDKPSKNEVPKTMSMAERMKLFESKSANNQNKPPIVIAKKVDKPEKKETTNIPVKKEIQKNKINLIEERLNSINKSKEPEKKKENITEPPKTGSSSFAERMKFLQNNANVITNQTKPPINIGHTGKVAMFEKPQTEAKKEEPVKMGSFEERQQQMRMRLMTMPGMGMMKRPELKKEETEQDKEDNKQEVVLHKAVGNIQNKPVRKIRRKTMAPKFNFDGK